MKTTPTIGEMIKVTFEESGMSMSEFAGKIHASCPDVYSLFKKDDISLKQLRLISEVLNHDFMKDLCDQPNKKEAQSNVCLDGKVFTGQETNACDKDSYRQKADVYLRNKKHTPLYQVEFETSENDHINCYLPLGEDDVLKLREATLAGDDLIELHDWDSDIIREDLHIGEILDINNIDFQKVHEYMFTAYSIKDCHSKPTIVNFSVVLTDSQYINLLVHLMSNRYLTVRQLEKIDKPLYDNIIRSVPFWIEAEGKSFVVFMTEAQEDVSIILGEPDENEEVFSEIKNNGDMFHVLAHLHEGILELAEESVIDGDITSGSTYKVSADLAKEALGARSFKDIIDVLKKKYSTRNAIDKIRERIEKNEQ